MLTYATYANVCYGCCIPRHLNGRDGVCFDRIPDHLKLLLELLWHWGALRLVGGQERRSESGIGVVEYCDHPPHRKVLRTQLQQ